MVMTAPPPLESEPPPAAPRMRTGHVLLLIFGSLLALTGLALTSIAAVLAWAAFAQRDGRFVTTDTERYETTTYALATEELNVIIDPGLPAIARGDVSRILVRGTQAAPDREIFIGIGPQSEVSQYLGSVEHSVLTDVRYAPFRPQYRTVPGTRAPAPPGRAELLGSLRPRPRHPASGHGAAFRELGDRGDERRCQSAVGRGSAGRSPD